MLRRVETAHGDVESANGGIPAMFDGAIGLVLQPRLWALLFWGSVVCCIDMRLTNRRDSAVVADST
jgi:hypothetical protein